VNHPRYILNRIPEVMVPIIPINRQVENACLLTEANTAVMAGMDVMPPVTMKDINAPGVIPCSTSPETMAGAT